MGGVYKQIEGECKLRPGQPGRSDPKDGTGIPTLLVKKRANSRNRREIGAVPEVSERPIEGTFTAGMDRMREKSAQKMRDLERVTAADTVR